MAASQMKASLENLFKELFRLMKKHWIFTAFMIVLMFLNVLVILFRPQLPGILALENPALGTYYPYYPATLLGLSIQAVFFIYTIGFFLLYRWVKTGKSVISTLLWALAFLIYGITFIGLIFQSFGFAWANSKDPTLFFLYRQSMIWWITLMFAGIASIFTKSIKKQVIPALFFLGIGYMWFFIGLFGFGNIEYTMYVFLYSFWVPVCAAIAYFFYMYGRNGKVASPKIIAFGFAMLGITYLAWSAWHIAAVMYVYFLWFFTFDISLTIILLGYVVLPYEMKAKAKTEEE